MSQTAACSLGNQHGNALQRLSQTRTLYEIRTARASDFKLERARPSDRLAKALRGNYPLGMSALEEIEKTVLALPVEQRAVLAESLLESLPPAGDVWSEVEEQAEVERRQREIETGLVRPLPESEFWKRVEAGRKR